MFSFYCSVSLYARLTNRNVRMDSNRSVCCESFGVFFVGKLVNLGLSLLHFIKRYQKLLTLSRALLQISFVGLLALSFPKKVDGSPRKTGSKEKGNQKTALFFDISVNWTENTTAPRLVSSFPQSTPEWTSRGAV